MENTIYSWNAEEVCMASCYWNRGKAREKVVAEIEEAMPHMETIMQELARRVVRKLLAMPEEEYGELVFRQ